MNKLKPCPFCGKSAHVEKHVTAIGNESFQVQHLCKSLLSDLKTFCYPSEAEAIAAWNRRPDKWTPLPEPSKQAIEILEKHRTWASDDEDTANAEGRIAAALKARQEVEAFMTTIDALSRMSGWSHRKEIKMTELYAVWDSLDNEFQIGNKEEVEKLYAKAKDEIMECINDGYSGEDEKVLMLKVIKKAEIVLDEDNKDDPKEHGYDYWIKWQDTEPEPRKLTLKELKQKEGTPVWTCTIGTDNWNCEIVCGYETHDDGDVISMCSPSEGGNYDTPAENYGVTWVAYDRPPGGEEL